MAMLLPVKYLQVVVMWRWFFMVFTLFFTSAQAAELQGVGVFSTLEKPWFLTGLYTDKEQQPQRLEFRIVEEKITPYRFRQLWQQAFAVAHENDVWQQHQQDLEQFFSVLHGPLQTNDQLLVEQQDGSTVVSINYREHARLSEEFLPLLVQTLTARITLVPELREGLTGQQPAAEQRDLLRDYDRAQPSLGRIAETARWLRQRQQAASAASSASSSYSGSVGQL